MKSLCLETDKLGLGVVVGQVFNFVTRVKLQQAVADDLDGCREVFLGDDQRRSQTNAASASL